LFTIKQEDFDKIKNNPDFTVIGHATDMVNVYRLNTKAGNSFEIKAQGWEHFSSDNK
jgi:thiamine-monophosphate kinase